MTTKMEIPISNVYVFFCSMNACGFFVGCLLTNWYLRSSLNLILGPWWELTFIQLREVGYKLISLQWNDFFELQITLLIVTSQLLNCISRVPLITILSCLQVVLTVVSNYLLIRTIWFGSGSQISTSFCQLWNSQWAGLLFTRFAMHFDSVDNLKSVVWWQ